MSQRLDRVRNAARQRKKERFTALLHHIDFDLLLESFLGAPEKPARSKRVKVPNSKGVANHAVPESCVAYREVRGEALTGVRTGQPWSRDRIYVLGADTVQIVEGNTDGRVIASTRQTRRGRRTWHVRTLLEREPGDLGFDQSLLAGPHREGEEP